MQCIFTPLHIIVTNLPHPSPFTSLSVRKIGRRNGMGGGQLFYPIICEGPFLQTYHVLPKLGHHGLWPHLYPHLQPWIRNWLQPSGSQRSASIEQFNYLHDNQTLMQFYLNTAHWASKLHARKSAIAWHIYVDLCAHKFPCLAEIWARCQDETAIM